MRLRPSLVRDLDRDLLLPTISLTGDFDVAFSQPFAPLRQMGLKLGDLSSEPSDVVDQRLDKALKFLHDGRYLS